MRIGLLNGYSIDTWWWNNWRDVLSDNWDITLLPTIVIGRQFAIVTIDFRWLVWQAMLVIGKK